MSRKATFRAPDEAPTSGVQKCACGKTAYYWTNEPVCGRCRGADTEFANLRKVPKTAAAKAAEWAARQDSLRLHTRALTPHRGNGSLMFTRINKGLMQLWNPPFVEGFWRVYPNHRAEAAPGEHFPQLSPKVMGPVRDARTTGLWLENAHQGSKMFAGEVDPITHEPKEDALEFRKHFWELKHPRRHKYPADILAKEAAKMPGRNVNNCMVYSFFYGFNGKNLKLSYLEARMFYAQWYVYFARQSQFFRWMREQLEKGYDVEICGYDVPFEGRVDGNAMERQYFDESTPYGHECVLAAMLLGVAPQDRLAGQAVYEGLFPTRAQAPDGYSGPLADGRATSDSTRSAPELPSSCIEPSGMRTGASPSSRPRSRSHSHERSLGGAHSHGRSQVGITRSHERSQGRTRSKERSRGRTRSKEHSRGRMHSHERPPLGRRSKSSQRQKKNNSEAVWERPLKPAARSAIDLD